MITVTTTKPVNIRQFVTSFPGVLSVEQTSGRTTFYAHDETTTLATLQAAVDAHVAVDEVGNRATLEQRAQDAVTAHKTFLALASPTTAQTLAQVRLLTRTDLAEIRLILNRYDGTD